LQLDETSVAGHALPRRANQQKHVKPSSQKYSALPKFGNDVLIAHPARHEGRIAIVTKTRVRDAVDADSAGARLRVED
jgi:hypothetical protein